MLRLSPRPARSRRRVVEVTSLKTLDQLTADGKSIVMFYAPWCGACKVVKPEFTQLAKEHPKIKFYLVKADDKEEFKEEYDISYYPTFWYFENGQGDEVDTPDEVL